MERLSASESRRLCAIVFFVSELVRSTHLCWLEANFETAVFSELRFLLDDGAPAPARMVGHLNGKRYLRSSIKVALEVAERAKASLADVPESEDGLATDELAIGCRYYQRKA